MDKVAFIGGGNIAEALVKGLLAAGVRPDHISVSDPTETRRDLLESRYKIATHRDNGDAIRDAETVVLAVKPAVTATVCREIRERVGRKRIVSVAAGVTSVSLLTELAGDTRLVRVMPNTPALVGAGMSAICAAGKATEEDLDAVRRMLESVGRVLVVPESLMDAVTGLSGSGPAYVFLVIEALADGGVRAGLPRADALQLAAQTVFGAAKLVLESGRHPGELKDMVTSPGGTTIEGLARLEQGGLRSLMIDAVTAAARRSRELRGE